MILLAPVGLLKVWVHIGHLAPTDQLRFQAADFPIDQRALLSGPAGFILSSAPVRVRHSVLIPLYS